MQSLIRTCCILVLVLGPARLACAQAGAQLPGPSVPSGLISREDLFEIDFGGRLTNLTGEPSRFQRFRDFRNGPTVERFRYQTDRSTWLFSAAADHVGYRDQRFTAAINRFGRLKASVEWNQVPLFYSAQARTPFTETSPGTLVLRDALQATVEARTATSSTYLQDIRRFDLRSRRDVADLRLTYSASRELDFKVSMTSTGRTGAQPYGASFGLNNAIELPVSIDQRTNDLNATAEWSNARGMARVAYDGSWFVNRVPNLVWDNPLRLTDTTTAAANSAGNAASLGRMALWPDSTAHTVSAAGAMNLPARSRAFAYLSVGTWLQDEQLLPHTINTAIAPIALARPSAQAEARIVSMNYRFTSRPTNTLWFNAQLRTYDYDNRTPRFAVEQYVRLDGNTSTSATGGSEPFSYFRNFLDLDASYTPFRFVAFRAGYGFQRDDRSFRFLDETREHTVRGSVDSTGFSWGTVRLQYDHSVRTGRGLDEEVLSEIGEQVSLRQFDISDRTRDRVSAIVQVVPFDILALNAQVSVGQDHRPDAAFGLQDNNLRGTAFGLDLTPSDSVIIGASYAFERYTTLQRSRQANPGVQFNDPTRDWSTNMGENNHTLNASLELPRITEQTSLRVGLDGVWARAQYRYLLPANSTLATPAQLPAVVNRVQRASIDLRQTLARQVTLGIGYAFDAYRVEDFAFGGDTLTSPVLPTLINLTNLWAPYDAHTGYVRLFYRW